jgi:hypothetical protein
LSVGGRTVPCGVSMTNKWLGLAVRQELSFKRFHHGIRRDRVLPELDQVTLRVCTVVPIRPYRQKGRADGCSCLLGWDGALRIRPRKQVGALGQPIAEGAMKGSQWKRRFLEGA